MKTVSTYGFNYGGSPVTIVDVIGFFFFFFLERSH